ncbi:hypothetical protein O3M35_006209 [Rhynocoris fuscipes]|uniref:NADP-dependent oxidoreductase domain-containing protein n=1 Tax=Rhynocoris fuscipes TaxID=488301 RepID=A0AAW1DDZ2_9HEMI
MSSQPHIKFNNGISCPLLGLGTYKSTHGTVIDVVKNAIDIGYRHFDTAHFYMNESEIGVAINEKMKEGVTRDSLFITSKLWNNSHKKEMVVPALKETLAKLKLDYLDLYLIHWPTGFKEGNELLPFDENKKLLYSDTHFTETWKGMEECVQQGLAKSIGISNFNSKQVQEILDIATIKPVNNQVECHPYFNQTKLIDFCKSKGITVTAYSPLGSPFRPPNEPGKILLLEDPKLKEIAEKHGKTPAQVLIRYQIEREVIVIPKSANKERLANNFEALSFSLTKEDMNELNSLNKPDGRLIVFQEAADHRDYPFNIEF